MRSLAYGCSALILAATAGCKSDGEYRRDADEAAAEIIASTQIKAFGEVEPFTIEQPADTLRKRLLIDQKLPYTGPESLGTFYLPRIPHWPDDDYLDVGHPDYDPLVNVPEGEALELGLLEALQVAARSSREYQTRKEAVFLAALDLNLERDAFDTSLAGTLQGGAEADLEGEDVTGLTGAAALSAAKLFKNGATVTSRIGVDLAKLLTQSGDSSLGIFADASITVPLLRGAGRWIVTEPLIQAERDALYAIWEFERFKRTFAVEIADEYLSVLQQADQVENAADNYRRAVVAARRARRLADAGLLPEIDVAQALQSELSARSSWINARQNYLQTLDGFKITLGLPVDAWITLDPEELERLAADTQEAVDVAIEPTMQPEDETPPATEPQLSADAPVDLVMPELGGGGPLELDQERAVALALGHRLDLRVALSEVYDAQRAVAIAADLLEPELTLLGAVATGEGRSLGSAVLTNSTDLGLARARYDALLTLDLPLDRTSERNQYRASLIALERAVRDAQAAEDEVKFQIRNDLRDLLEAREGLRIQLQAVEVAERRVASTNLFLQAGRAEIRDVLEAQEDLVDAQNAFTSALVDYRVTELELQRDMGLLEVDDRGLWQEYVPEEIIDDAE